MKTYTKTMLAMLVAMIPAVAHAGAGATVYGCIYSATAPISPLSVTFTAGGNTDHCMSSSGHNATFSVSAAGVTCGSVGYVESKSSSSGGDTCATDTSVWNLSYSIAGTASTGSTQSTWWHPILSSNHMALQQSSSGTSVCGNSNLCTSTSQVWDSGTTGPLYIIFQPAS